MKLPFAVTPARLETALAVAIGLVGLAVTLGLLIGNSKRIPVPPAASRLAARHEGGISNGMNPGEMFIVADSVGGEEHLVIFGSPGGPAVTLMPKRTQRPE